MKRFVLLLFVALVLLSSSIAHAFTPAHLWSLRLGGMAGDTGYGTAVDGLGNVYVTGVFQGTANFGGSDPTSSGAARTKEMVMLK